MFKNKRKNLKKSRPKNLVCPLDHGLRLFCCRSRTWWSAGTTFAPSVWLWSNKDGERSVGLQGLHKLLAQDPALGLAVLRGLKEWEHNHQCTELWGPSRPYKPSQWAHLGEVGWLGCEDAGLWRGMGAGEAKEVKKEREGASTTTTTPPSTPPPQKSKGVKAPPPPLRKEEEVVRVGLGRRVRQPRLFLFVLRRGPPPPRIRTPPKSKAVPAPKDNGREKKAEGGGKEARGGG